MAQGVFSLRLGLVVAASLLVLSQTACGVLSSALTPAPGQGDLSALGKAREGSDWAFFYGMDDYTGSDTSAELKSIHAQLSSVGSGPRSSIFLAGDASTKQDGFRTRVTRGQAWGVGFEALGELQTNQAPALRDFLGWVSRQAPKRRLHLTLATHGGAYGGILLDYDGNPGVWAPSMSLQKANKALAKGYDGARLASIHFDACMMATIEVGEALKGSAEVMTGCEDFSFGGSTPYAEVAEQLASGATLGGEAFGRHLAEATVRRGKWGERGTRQWSAIRLDRRYDELVKRVNRLARALRKALPAERANILRALTETPMFGAMASYQAHYGDFGQRDLIGVARSFLARVQDPHVQASAKDVVAGTQDVVIALERFPTETMANGLAIFVPAQAKDAATRLPSYRRSLFAQHTEWDEFLTELHR